MDKASDFGSEDCRFESCQGRGCDRGHLIGEWREEKKAHVRESRRVSDYEEGEKGRGQRGDRTLDLRVISTTL
ncbi:unnamed protein product [Rodentolepis nana]|uniref:Uncharacterized protein n=1 Tax=Rodentolepis nana TaxID=102285 RepID=A0A158QJ18_RODNA|nr:unnamed protein product [Rodentolepis nana]